MTGEDVTATQREVRPVPTTDKVRAEGAATRKGAGPDASEGSTPPRKDGVEASLRSPWPHWSRWPWDRCKAVTYGFQGETMRCDLVKRHGGHHRAERGMYDVVWDSVPRMTDPAHG